MYPRPLTSDCCTVRCFGLRACHNNSDSHAHGLAPGERWFSDPNLRTLFRPCLRPEAITFTLIGSQRALMRNVFYGPVPKCKVAPVLLAAPVRSTFACSSSLRYSERSACGREAGPAALPARAAGSLSSGLRALRTPPHRIGLESARSAACCELGEHCPALSLAPPGSALPPSRASSVGVYQHLAQPGPSRALPFAAPCPCRLLRLVHGERTGLQAVPPCRRLAAARSV